MLQDAALCNVCAASTEFLSISRAEVLTRSWVSLTLILETEEKKPRAKKIYRQLYWKSSISLVHVFSSLKPNFPFEPEKAKDGSFVYHSFIQICAGLPSGGRWQREPGPAGKKCKEGREECERENLRDTCNSCPEPSRSLGFFPTKVFLKESGSDRHKFKS